MEPSSRDRISVDLHGLKAKLFERAQALGVSPSGLVRTALAEVLGKSDPIATEPATPSRSPANGDRVRLSLRMSRRHANAILEAAKRAGLNPGDYVGGLVEGVPVLMGKGSRTEHVTRLTASNAELSTLSRNIHRLTALLRQGNVEPARPYREMLDTLANDVHRHLELAAGALAELQPRSRGAGTPTRPTP